MAHTWVQALDVNDNLSELYWSYSAWLLRNDRLCGGHLVCKHIFLGFYLSII
jgi:hypothetical protein